MAGAVRAGQSAQRQYINPRTIRIVEANCWAMASTTKKKKRLFAAGAAALERVNTRARGRYGCPTCTNLFPIEALATGELTLEHVPAKAVGGKGIALTCRRCNSTAGHKLDAAVDGRERWLNLGRAFSNAEGQFEGPVTVRMQGGTMNARLLLRDHKATVMVLEAINDPHNFQSQLLALQGRRTANPTIAVQFEMSARIPLDFGRARIGDVRSAFIATFARFGYSYAYHPRMKQVREQILNPDEKLLEGACWMASRDYTGDPMMMLVRSPFPLVLVGLGWDLVMLPWFDGPDDFYPAIRAHLLGHESEMIGEVWPWPRTLELLLDS